MATGRDMMSGNNNGESFEQRMQNIGDDIERNVTAKAAGVEKAAERLCESLKAVDDAEEQVSQISELKELNIVKFNSRA